MGKENVLTWFGGGRHIKAWPVTPTVIINCQRVLTASCTNALGCWLTGEDLPGNGACGGGEEDSLREVAGIPAGWS